MKGYERGGRGKGAGKVSGSIFVKHLRKVYEGNAKVPFLLSGAMSHVSLHDSANLDRE